MADKTKLGMEFPYTFEVEKGKIAEFAMAISQKESKDQVKAIYWVPRRRRQPGMATSCRRPPSRPALRSGAAAG